ncbi:hypothetical protein PENTCL1PPCAC_8495, partial [Pristionchus entomophagus]
LLYTLIACSISYAGYRIYMASGRQKIRFFMHKIRPITDLLNDAATLFPFSTPDLWYDKYLKSECSNRFESKRLMDSANSQSILWNRDDELNSACQLRQ